MAKQKYGEAFVAGLKRNMAATGYIPPIKPAKPIGYFSKETLKRVPGEIIPSTKKVLGAIGRGVLKGATLGLWKRKKGKK
jgi:hypothetical protein